MAGIHLGQGAMVVEANVTLPWKSLGLLCQSQVSVPSAITTAALLEEMKGKNHVVQALTVLGGPANSLLIAACKVVGVG